MLNSLHDSGITLERLVKGFPNQVTNITKLTMALKVLPDIIDANGPHDDDSFGESLLRHGVINPGRGYTDIDAYLQASRLKSASNQSHRTSARALKEFMAKCSAIHTQAGVLRLTDSGFRLLDAFGTNDNQRLYAEWKSTVRNIWAADGEGNISHPYQVMLRLLTARPETPRAYCALALEAKDDSEGELQRIVALRDLDDEAAIRDALGVTKSTWDNAKKILPSIAEQIGDVIRGETSLSIVGDALNAETIGGGPVDRVTARKVAADTIAALKTPDDSDEILPIIEPGAVSLANAIAVRADRTARHNRLVRQFAGQLRVAGIELWEGLFDCLAVVESAVILAEMKTLDGSASDEVHQVRNAVGQLLYYEAFSIPTEALSTGLPIIKVAVFEMVPSRTHIQWMESLAIQVVWAQDDLFSASKLSSDVLSGYLALYR